jgi:hypothetical protein
MKFDVIIITTTGNVKLTVYAMSGDAAKEHASDYASSRGLEVEDILYVGYRV